MLKIEVLLKKILLGIIWVIVIVGFIPIVLLFRVMIEIIDSITSSNGLYLMRKSLNIKILSISKNVTIFENQINWKEPITLTEGVFDDASKKKFLIPLLGKFIPKTLMDSIYKNGVKKISILLDKDVKTKPLYYVSYFMNNGITVTNILPTEKDASEMGFSQINKKLKNTESTEFSDIISQKLSTL